MKPSFLMMGPQVWRAIPEVVTNPREKDHTTACCSGNRFGLCQVAGFDIELWDALEDSELPDIARGRNVINYFYQVIHLLLFDAIKYFVYLVEFRTHAHIRNLSVIN